MSRGGSRYGAGRPAHNIKAESTQRIEIRRWVREGRFDGIHHFTAGWTQNGEPSGSIGVATSRDGATLIYRTKDARCDEWQDRQQQISVVRTPCNYGGYRRWFRCPVCDRRCELLYLRSARFACRKCQLVAYASQSGALIDRLIHKSHKLQRRIEGGKPRGMRWTTYRAIFDKVSAIEEQADRLFAIRCAGLIGLLD